MKILCDRCKREYEAEEEPEKWQEAMCPSCFADAEEEEWGGFPPDRY